MIVVGVQTRSDFYKSNDIFGEVTMTIKQATIKGAKLICFPELFCLPFFPNKIKEEHFTMAEDSEGLFIQRMSEIAKENQVNLITPFFEKSGEFYFNSAAVIGEDGKLLGIARKNYIPFSKWNNEKYYFKPSSPRLPIFNIDGLKIAIIICYDRHYPEISRLAALQGVELLVVPTTSVSMSGRSDTYQAELISRAIENNMYVMGINRVGLSKEGQYFGKSVIISPAGEILSFCDDQKEGWVTAELSSEQVTFCRNKFGHLRNIRKDIFEEIMKIL